MISSEYGEGTVDFSDNDITVTIPFNFINGVGDKVGNNVGNKVGIKVGNKVGNKTDVKMTNDGVLLGNLWVFWVKFANS